MRKSASVTVNDNSRDNFSLKFHGALYNHTEPESLQPLAMTEAMFKFDPNERGEKKEIAITNVSSQELHLRLAAGAPEFFEVDLPSRVKPGKSERIEVRVLKDVEKDRFEKSFTIEMDDAERTRLTIPVVLDSEIPITTPRPEKLPSKIQRPGKADTSKVSQSGAKSGN